MSASEATAPDAPFEVGNDIVVATASPTHIQRIVAELLGTFLLLFGAIGTALYAGNAVGVLGVALAFGLTIFVGISAWGGISGGHFNPAVTLGLAAAGRFAWRDVPTYLAAQIIGGVAGTSAIYLIGLAGPADWAKSAANAGFASNGFGKFSPAGFDLGAAIGIEIALTAVFVLVILGVTHATRGNVVMSGLAIGLTLTLIHLVSIPVDNTSVNPARSIATAIYGGPEALSQLWVFIVFPILGGLLGGWLHRLVFERRGRSAHAHAHAH